MFTGDHESLLGVRYWDIYVLIPSWGKRSMSVWEMLMRTTRQDMLKLRVRRSQGELLEISHGEPLEDASGTYCGQLKVKTHRKAPNSGLSNQAGCFPDLEIERLRIDLKVWNDRCGVAKIICVNTRYYDPLPYLVWFRFPAQDYR